MDKDNLYYLISQNIKKKKNKRKDTSKTCYEKQYKCRLLKKN